MVPELKQLLLKEQTVPYTIEAALTNTDFAEVEAPEFKWAAGAAPIKLSGANSGERPSIIGGYEADVTFSLPLRYGGAEGNAGLFGKVIKAMGFALADTDTDADLTDDKLIWTPSDNSDNHKAMTAWGYSGNKGTGKAILHKIGNVMFGGKLALDFDQCTTKLSAEGKGYYSGVATAATQASVTPSSVLVPSLKGCLFSIFGDSDYKPVSFEIDFNQSAVVTIDPTTSSGKGPTVLKRNGAMKWTAKVYKDIPSVVDPETQLTSGATGALSISWGATPNKWTISGTLQLTGLASSDQNGVEAWDMSGIIVDQDLSIQLETVTA
jgi:hypothetical protein